MDSPSITSSQLRRRTPRLQSDRNSDEDPATTESAVVPTSVGARCLTSSPARHKLEETALVSSTSVELKAMMDATRFAAQLSSYAQSKAKEMSQSVESSLRVAASHSESLKISAHMAIGCQQTTRNATSPLTKKIFLSHSSGQGRFVEQLDEDLRNEGYLPFFHKDPASLPKGEKFPELILQNARECDVAVVVLSENYLLSKWPMLELETFFDAQKSDHKKILPLFYELGVADLKDEDLWGRMRDAWETHAAKDTRIKLVDWGNAVRALWGINGLVFYQGSSEIAYRKSIVRSIYNLCPPDVEFVLTHMVGNHRLCELVAGQLAKRKPATTGIYGMGGLGKTTLCKALCNHFKRRLYGRVCYLDFASGDALAVKKEALRRLTNLSDSILDQYKYEVQVDNLLKRLLPQQDVFIAIDNLPLDLDSTKLGTLAGILDSLSKGSMCILTTRSAETLKKVVPYLLPANIMPFPSLTEQEAMDLFVSVALPKRHLSSLTPGETEVVRTCANVCALKPTEFCFYPVYHPMALEALAYSLREVHSRDPLEWERQHAIPQALADDDLTRIYEIIGISYNTLNDAEKILFMDVAVFAPREKLKDVNSLLPWLAEVHDTNERNIKQRLKKFELLSLLKLGETSMVLHDFSIDFAHYALRSGLETWIQERCVFKEGGDTLPLALEGTPSGKCWEKLVRVRLQILPYLSGETVEEVLQIVEDYKFYRFKGTKLREWANLVVLHLKFGGEDIDIGPLRCLRALHLEADHHLKSFTCSQPLEQLRFVRFWCMFGKVKAVPHFDFPRLRELNLTVDMVVSLRKPITVPLTSTALTILRLGRWYTGRQHNEFDFRPFRNLVELVIESDFINHGHCKLYLLGLSSLTRLKKLVLRLLPIVGPLDGLEGSVELETLDIESYSSKMITMLPGLDRFRRLRHLNVSGTDVEELAGVETLMNLQELLCINCNRLQRLPDLSALPNLYRVVVLGCSLLESVSVPVTCGDVPLKFGLEDRPSVSLEEGVDAIIAHVLPTDVGIARLVNNIAANAPPLADTDVEELRNRVQQELQEMMIFFLQLVAQIVVYMSTPRFLVHWALTARRVKRDRARHEWENLDSRGKMIHLGRTVLGCVWRVHYLVKAVLWLGVAVLYLGWIVLHSVLTSRIAMRIYDIAAIVIYRNGRTWGTIRVRIAFTVVLLLGICVVVPMASFERKKLIIQVGATTLCEAILGYGVIGCRFMYSDGCLLLHSWLGSNSTLEYCTF